MRKILILMLAITTSELYAKTYFSKIDFTSNAYTNHCSGILFERCKNYIVTEYIGQHTNINIINYFYQKAQQGKLKYNNGTCTILNKPLPDSSLGIISQGINYFSADEFWAEDNDGNSERIQPDYIQINCDLY